MCPAVGGASYGVRFEGWDAELSGVTPDTLRRFGLSGAMPDTPEPSFFGEKRAP